MQKIKRYRTFTGVVYEACFPVAGLIGLSGNLIENLASHQMSYSTWIMAAFTALLAVVSWRGIFSGVIVKGDRISNRGLFKTSSFLLKDVNNVNVSGLVTPLGGPNLFRNDVGAQLTIKGGTEIDCPAIYGSFKKVDKAVAEIRKDVRDAKKKK